MNDSAQLFANEPNDPRDRTDSALLEEIVEPTPATTTTGTSTTTIPAAPVSENGSGSGNGSYVHVESETVAIQAEDGEEVVVESVVVEIGEGEDPPESVAA